MFQKLGGFSATCGYLLPDATSAQGGDAPSMAVAKKPVEEHERKAVTITDFISSKTKPSDSYTAWIPSLMFKAEDFGSNVISP